MHYKTLYTFTLMRPDDWMTTKDELAQRYNHVLKDDSNQPESDEKEPLSFTLELDEVDQQV